MAKRKKRGPTKLQLEKEKLEIEITQLKREGEKRDLEITQLKRETTKNVWWYIRKAAGAVPVATLLVTLWIVFNQFQTESARLETETANRFASVVQKLDSKDPSARLGAVLALEAFINESKHYRSQVYLLLGARLREEVGLEGERKARDDGLVYQICESLRKVSLARLDAEDEAISLYLVNGDFAGVRFTDMDLRKANFNKAVLDSAVLSGAYLNDANLIDAHLIGAYLIEANLSGAILTRAVLNGANLYGANLIEAILYYSNLSRASLGGANLSRASLGGANLSRANLYGANLKDTRLYNAAGLTTKQLLPTRSFENLVVSDSMLVDSLRVERPQSNIIYSAVHSVL